MNRIERKELAADAAKLFVQEVRGLRPDVPLHELRAMIFDYLFYQTDDMSKAEVTMVVDRMFSSPPLPRSHKVRRRRAA